MKTQILANLCCEFPAIFIQNNEIKAPVVVRINLRWARDFADSHVRVVGCRSYCEWLPSKMTASEANSEEVRCYNGRKLTSKTFQRQTSLLPPFLTRIGHLQIR